MAKSRATPKTKPAAKARPTAAAAPAQPRAAGDWRQIALDRMRALILRADPAMSEERKWRKPSNGMAGVPVWSHDGIVCTGETYKNVVKLTFAKGASLSDPAGLFNASLEGGTRRAIDIHEGEQVDAAAFQALVKAAVAHNSAPAKKAGTTKKPSAEKSSAEKSSAEKSSSKKPGVKQAQPVRLLSGGNPQIAKGHGDGPVQDYIAAMPGWKSEIGRRLDALIERAVPDVQKAVKWNSPFYGLAEPGEKPAWFLGIHCFNKYIKVAFFRGAALRPLPPGASKQKEVRYLDIHEDDELDEAQLAAWVQQASRLPGERM